MKRYIRSHNVVASTSSQSEIIQDIQNKIWNYLDDVIITQYRYDYFKQVKRQVSVNGRKYTIKNYAKYNTMVVTNPEGEEIFKSSFPDGASKRDAQYIATLILNDAYGDDTDIDLKRVELSVRSGYTSYGRNSSGPVKFGEYVDRLRRYAERNGDQNADARYAAVTICAWWSGNDEDIIFSDNASELISHCKKFIQEGANTPDGEDSVGSRKYRFYADVVDTQTGEEIYADKSESY